MVGRTQCELSVWKSATSVFCRVASGMGASFQLIFTSGAAVGRTRTAAFSYLGPEIFVPSPAIAFTWKFNYAVTGSIPITVQAVFLGLFSVTQNLRAGASSCEGTSWISDTQIIGVIPEGTGSTHVLAVTTGLSVGSASFAWSYDSPNLSETVVYPLTPSVATLIGTEFALADYSPGMHSWSYLI